MVSGRVPQKGDVFWIDFGPALGHEQAGRRPSLVISPEGYNARSSVVVLCPITRNPKPWPFKVEIPRLGRVHGFAILDQLRSIDLLARPHRFVGTLPEESMSLALERLASLFDLSYAENSRPLR